MGTIMTERVKESLSALSSSIDLASLDIYVAPTHPILIQEINTLKHQMVDLINLLLED